MAERLAKLVPAAELVRFSASGAEAVADALRLARAFTGRGAVVAVGCGPRGLLGRITSYNVCYTKLLRLRRKIEERPKKPYYLLAEWGIGYRLREPERVTSMSI